MPSQAALFTKAHRGEDRCFGTADYDDDPNCLGSVVGIGIFDDGSVAVDDGGSYRVVTTKKERCSVLEEFAVRCESDLGGLSGDEDTEHFGEWAAIARSWLEGMVVAEAFCCCGCGINTKGGLFAPGHDMKVKGLLSRAARGEALAVPYLLYSALRDNPDRLFHGYTGGLAISVLADSGSYVDFGESRRSVKDLKWDEIRNAASGR